MFNVTSFRYNIKLPRQKVFNVCVLSCRILHCYIHSFSMTFRIISGGIWKSRLVHPNWITGLLHVSVYTGRQELNGSCLSDEVGAVGMLNSWLAGLFYSKMVFCWNITIRLKMTLFVIFPNLQIATSHLDIFGTGAIKMIWFATGFDNRETFWHSHMWCDV